VRVRENITRTMPYIRVQVPAAFNEAYMALTARIDDLNARFDDLNDRIDLFDAFLSMAVVIMFAVIVFNMWVCALIRDEPRHRH
jgi:hypothetical protein